MIFWLGAERFSHFLIQIAFAENICFTTRKHKITRYLSSMAGSVRGYNFTKHTCVVRGNNIYIYKVEYSLEKTTLVYCDKWKIYTDKDPIDKLPGNVIIKTNDIDYIRELFISNRTVSWFDPDMLTCGKYLTMFDFKHLFVNIFSDKLIKPTGEVVPIRDEWGNYNFDIRNGLGSHYKPIKYAKKIGYLKKAMNERLDRVGQVRSRYRRYGKKYNIYPRVADWYSLAYFNFLSVTYMICRKSIAVSVKTKDALNE